MAPRTTFTTADEISSIKGLGTFHNEVSGRPPVSRKKLLRGYIMAASLRSDWGDIDKKKAIKFAQQELIREP